MVDPDDDEDDDIPTTDNEILLVQESDYDLLTVPRLCYPTADNSPGGVQCRFGFFYGTAAGPGEQVGAQEEVTGCGEHGGSANRELLLFLGHRAR